MEKSFKISTNKIEFLVNKFQKYVHTKINNPHLLFFCKLTNLTISIFKTKTILLQGNQEEIDQFVKKYLNNIDSKQKTPAPAKKIKKISQNVDGIIGCDEVGVGDYFGPLVTCACFVDNNKIQLFKKLDIIKDSKKLKDEQILKIAHFIRQHTTLFVSVCDNKTYNQLIDQYQNSKLVLSICHNLTLNKLNNLLKNKKYQTIMDEFVSESKYCQYLAQTKAKVFKIDQFLPKAEDKYLPVACASIVARAIFLNCIDQMKQKLQLKKIPLGASNTQEIVKVGKYINKKTTLADYAKIHFESITDKIIN